MFLRALVCGVFLFGSLAFGARKTLDIYFIDVEGGQATLYVSPSGESMLVDAGWPGFNGRDAARIAAAARAAKVKRIDYMVVTHYHTDHVGGVPELAERLPLRTYVDHGPSFESGKSADALMQPYFEARKKGKHLEVKPGDRIPVKGLDIHVVAAAGERITVPVNGGGADNPLCASFQLKAEDKSENARSIGNLVAFGKFRIVNLGDLTWNKEGELACPQNLLGNVDVYLSTHHGLDASGPDVIVHALRPRIAVINNGAKKGGSPSAWQVIRNSPGIEDIWQLHFALGGGKEHNAADPFIANLDQNCEGKWIKISAEPDGSFTVTNGRNGYSKRYAARN